MRTIIKGNSCLLRKGIGVNADVSISNNFVDTRNTVTVYIIKTNRSRRIILGKPAGM